MSLAFTLIKNKKERKNSFKRNLMWFPHKTHNHGALNVKINSP